MFVFMCTFVLAYCSFPSTGMATGFLVRGGTCNTAARYATCPDGQCCVRDAFMLEVTKCKPFTRAGERCVTRLSALECPCGDGLECRPSHTGAIFGTCRIPYTTTTALTSCNITARFSSCPAGYCCVRDDFLFTETRCKPLGKAGASCSTRRSEFECPCDHNFRCLSNIHGSHISSIFGKCHDPDTTAPTVTTDYPASSNSGGSADEITTDSDVQPTSASSQTVQLEQSSTPMADPPGDIVG